MVQQQMMTRLPHNDMTLMSNDGMTRTHGDNMWLGDNNTHEDDDKGPGPPTNGDEAHHPVMSPFHFTSHFPSPSPFPLASPFYLTSNVLLK